MKTENHLLERVCSQFTYEQFPRTTKSTCKLVDAVQQRHNISQVACALIQVNVVLWKLGRLLSTLQASDNKIFPESQARAAIRSPVTLTVEIVCSK